MQQLLPMSFNIRFGSVTFWKNCCFKQGQPLWHREIGIWIAAARITRPDHFAACSGDSARSTRTPAQTFRRGKLNRFLQINGQHYEKNIQLYTGNSPKCWSWTQGCDWTFCVISKRQRCKRAARRCSRIGQACPPLQISQNSNPPFKLVYWCLLKDQELIPDKWEGRIRSYLYWKKNSERQKNWPAAYLQSKT